MAGPEAYHAGAVAVGNERILVVDDDRELADLIASGLKLHDYAAVCVTSAAEALEAAHGFDPDVVILDLDLGDGDAVCVLEQLARSGRGAAVLPISGYDMRLLNSTASIARSLGLSTLPPLRKPFRLQDVRAALDRLPAEQRRLRDADLRAALEAGEITPHFQPKVDLESGRPVGAEALARWRNPARGLIAPDIFVPLAERSALVQTLTDHMLRASLQACRGWWDRGRALPVAVNVSAHDVMDLGFPAGSARRWSSPGCRQRLSPWR